VDGGYECFEESMSEPEERHARTQVLHSGARDGVETHDRIVCQVVWLLAFVADLTAVPRRLLRCQVKILRNSSVDRNSNFGYLHFRQIRGCWFAKTVYKLVPKCLRLLLVGISKIVCVLFDKYLQFYVLSQFRYRAVCWDVEGL
jgi:hypothetical protein